VMTIFGRVFMLVYLSGQSSKTSLDQLPFLPFHPIPFPARLRNSKLVAVLDALVLPLADRPSQDSAPTRLWAPSRRRVCPVRCTVRLSAVVLIWQGVDLFRLALSA